MKRHIRQVLNISLILIHKLDVSFEFSMLTMNFHSLIEKFNSLKYT